MKDKIAVINYSGNVGKTLIVRHLLAPRLPNAEIISVESINQGLDESEGEILKANQCKAIFSKVLLAEKIIVDVGSSNAEQFIEHLKAFRGAQNLFDLFIVPTVPSRKQMSDTLDTIIMLSALGIEPHQIQVVLNMCEPKTLRDDFSPLFAFHKEKPLFSLDERAAIYKSEIYDSIKGTEKTVADLALEDISSWREKIKLTSNYEEKHRLAKFALDTMLARPVHESHETIFNIVFE